MALSPNPFWFDWYLAVWCSVPSLMSWWQHLQPLVWNNHSHTSSVWRLETRPYEEKRNWKCDVNCNRGRQIFLVLYDIETKAHCCFSTFTERFRYIFAITINIWICTILYCSQKKLLWNYVLDKWLPFVKFWKMYCISWSTFAKGVGLLVLYHNKNLKNLFKLRYVWNKNLGRTFYFAHFLCSSTTYLMEVLYFVHKCLVLVQ